jgi:hypothetical protein
MRSTTFKPLARPLSHSTNPSQSHTKELLQTRPDNRLTSFAAAKITTLSGLFQIIFKEKIALKVHPMAMTLIMRVKKTGAFILKNTRNVKSELYLLYIAPYNFKLSIVHCKESRKRAAWAPSICVW